ncbi:hypothetical protein N9M98_01965 [Candidatus Pseudothioglobus singularis]|nr:hypothetical protein [Candidatus Pseudothioglobus singularis]
MNKILAFIAAVVAGILSNFIFGPIIAVLSVFVESLGLASYRSGGFLDLTGVVFSIFLSFYVGYKVYKRITRVKESKVEE